MQLGSTFSITIEPAELLIHANIHGFMMLADVEAFEAELFAKATQLTGRSAGAPISLLCIIQNPSAQSGTVIERFQETAMRARSRFAKRAIVATSALTTMQARRIDEPAIHRVFKTEGEARKWLAAP